MAKPTIRGSKPSATITSEKVAVTIIGSGPAGMIAALELAQRGIKSTLIGPKTNSNDMRTTALMMPQIAVLERLNVWKSVEKQAAALSTMRIIDGTSRLVRSPTVSFRASEIGEKAFGYNMPNIALNNVLAEAVEKTVSITRLYVSAIAYTHKDDHIIVTLSDGSEIKTALVVAGDGRSSPAREAAGIATRQWRYPQTAVILSFSHPLPHQNISTEFHTEYGPFTQVPLPGNNSSLVWVTSPNEANRLLGLGKEALGEEIEKRMQSMLGEITVTTAAQAWPLGGIVPKKFAAQRTILIGEAAHVFPPIGAQGLNLGVRDAVALAEAVVKDKTDPGSCVVIKAYNQNRFPDIWLRTGSVHALNRALLSNMLPAQLLRNAGLETLRRIAPLRGIFMREGMHPGHGLKSIAESFCPPLLKKKCKNA